MYLLARMLTVLQHMFRNGLMERHCLQMDAERDAIAQRPKTSPRVAMRSTNMCYIIFTSGSTGRPKGTVLQHAGVVNYFLSLVE